jgi:hypothetical protein
VFIRRYITAILITGLVACGGKNVPTINDPMDEEYIEDNPTNPDGGGSVTPFINSFFYDELDTPFVEGAVIPEEATKLTSEQLRLAIFQDRMTARSIAVREIKSDEIIGNNGEKYKLADFYEDKNGNIKATTNSVYNYIYHNEDVFGGKDVWNTEVYQYTYGGKNYKMLLNPEYLADDDYALVF